MQKTWKEKQQELRKDSKERLFNAKKEIEVALEHVKEMVGKELFIYPLWERWGRGNRLYNLFWWDIKIQPQYLIEALKQKDNEYTDILFLPYRITRREIGLLLSNRVKKGEEYIVNENSWGVKDHYPHLDFTTGNVHKEFNVESWDGKIKQVVLVKKKYNGHLGPRKAYKIDTWEPIEVSGDDFIIYKRGKGIDDEVNKIAVPKVCHFPQLLDHEFDEGDNVEALLEGLLKNVLDGNIKKPLEKNRMVL